ncbi:response regulator [Viridibacterium curvum]|uniref:Response regulatory domain-containing protein n=1 Tax=Viridibacterium curvum TaxID=1101404 RepID=A0ABP9QDZ3_9RHOO
MSSRILIVDDEAHVLAALQRLLRRDPALVSMNVVVETAESAAAALQRASQVSFDLVLSDYRMPFMDGLSFLHAFRTLQPDTTRMILSGATDFDVLMAAINDVGIVRFLTKPWDESEVVRAVQEGIAITRLKREEQRLADERRAEQDPQYREQLARAEIALKEPGILSVDWGPNGEVLLEEDGAVRHPAP